MRTRADSTEPALVLLFVFLLNPDRYVWRDGYEQWHGKDGVPKKTPQKIYNASAPGSKSRRKPAYSMLPLTVIWAVRAQTTK
jgi:hypothetical protein